MKASELIAEIAELISEHGDCRVITDLDGYDINKVWVNEYEQEDMSCFKLGYKE